MNAQQNYEQLKRRNRRRLMGALIMVLVAVILLVTMINHRSAKQVVAPQLDVVTNASSQPNSGNDHVVSSAGQDVNPNPEILVNNLPADASAASASQSVVANVHSPIYPNPSASEISGQQTQQQVHSTGNTSGENNHNVVANVPTDSTSNTSAQTSTGNVVAHVPDNANGQHHVQENKNRSSTSVAGKTETGSKKSVNKANAAKGNNKPSLKKLTPQQILENKAANLSMVSPATNKVAKTVTTNSVPKERTIIQVGAYTTEAQAKIVQQKLAAIGITSNISSGQTSKGTLFRVRSSIYNSRELAVQNLNKIQAAGMSGIVIGL